MNKSSVVSKEKEKKKKKKRETNLNRVTILHVTNRDFYVWGYNGKNGRIIL